MQDVLSDLYWAHRSDANVRNLVWREGEVSLDSLLEQDSAYLAFEPNPVHCFCLFYQRDMAFRRYFVA